MIVKSTALTQLIINMRNETNEAESSRVAIAEYKNQAGEVCQLQLVATSCQAEHLHLNPALDCIIR